MEGSSFFESLCGSKENKNAVEYCAKTDKIKEITMENKNNLNSPSSSAKANEFEKPSVDDDNGIANLLNFVQANPFPEKDAATTKQSNLEELLLAFDPLCDSRKDEYSAQDSILSTPHSASSAPGLSQITKHQNVMVQSVPKETNQAGKPREQNQAGNTQKKTQSCSKAKIQGGPIGMSLVGTKSDRMKLAESKETARKNAAVDLSKSLLTSKVFITERNDTAYATISLEDLKKALSSTDTNTTHTERDGETLSSHNMQGDVKIPEICVFSLADYCKQAATGCPRLHACLPFHWQFKHGNSWCNFKVFHSRMLEAVYQDPYVENFELNCFDDKNSDFKSDMHFKLLGRETWKIDFNSMKMVSSSTSVMLPIRRLSTNSSVVFKHRFSTQYVWYWFNEFGKWTGYGESSSHSRTEFIPAISSNEIEMAYVSKSKRRDIEFRSSHLQYKLIFNTMKQINAFTCTERPVRRRPKSCGFYHLEGNLKMVPVTWSAMNINYLEMCAVMPNSKEFMDIKLFMEKSYPQVSIQKIIRIQNVHLWQSYWKNFLELCKLYGGKKNLNVQQLFHGTSGDKVQSICERNLDCQLQGKSHGSTFGKGINFTNDITLARAYCGDHAPHHIFVYRVIVGDVTLGLSCMVRPPVNAQTNLPFLTTVDDVAKPRIFVKYGNYEYYPEYIVCID